MSFAETMDEAGHMPVERPSGCLCPPILDGWTEECPVHPDDPTGPLVVQEAARRVLAEHNAACIANAEDFANPGLVPDDDRIIAAEFLADGEVACICGGVT